MTPSARGRTKNESTSSATFPEVVKPIAAPPTSFRTAAASTGVDLIIAVSSLVAESTAVTPEVAISSRSPRSHKRRKRRISSNLDAPVVPSPVVLEDLTPVVQSPVVLEDPTPVVPSPVVLEDPTPVVPSPVDLEDPTPMIPSPVVLQDPNPVVSDVVTEAPDFTAAAIIKKAVFAFHLMAVLHAWTASGSTQEPAPVREPPGSTPKPALFWETSESTQEPAPVYESTLEPCVYALFAMFAL